jgi:acetyltransferase-like isoleucine patch superfamily enzyme
LPLPKLFLADTVGVCIGLLPGLIAWASALTYLHFIWDTPHFAPKAFAFPPILVFTYLPSVFLIRLCLPKLKPGVYEMNSAGMRAWYMHFLLANGLYASGLQPVVYCTYLTRFLYWRAMGAKTAYGIHCAVFTRMRDFALITIGDGVNLSADTHIACHTFVGDKLLLGRVEIGDRVFLGMDVVIGPKTKIGNGAWIGLGNRLMRETIPENAKIDNFEYFFGNAERQKRMKASPAAAAEGEST